jgi:endonuclease/exonuclease/phosphatase family metal-dependent hydrolase
LLKKYFVSDKKDKWFIINEVRNKLYSISKDKKSISLKATGRNDWLGWVELTRENVDEESTQNTARVIDAVGSDVMCVVEVEDRIALNNFNRLILKDKAFAHNMLIDGNDDRGIDVGILSKYPIESIVSHIDDSYTDNAGRKQLIFSRDCPVYKVNRDSSEPLYVLCNHLKSKGYGTASANDAKRKHQAEKIAEIISKFDLKKDYVVVAGDFNDTQDSDALQPLLQYPDLYNTFTKLNGPHWTYQDGKDQIDYLLVSKALYDKQINVGIEPRGIYSKKKGYVPFPEVTSKVNQASDHAAIWAEFNI